MKKVLISILVILLMILTYFLILKDINIANWNNKSIDDIKKLNTKMNEQIDIAKQLKNQEYPDSISNLEQSIEDLKIAKEKYESKLKYISDNVQVGIVKVKEYKIERLWIALELYAKEENVDLKLDILDTATNGVYDLNVTVVGTYIGITDFIYDIEKDDTLGFKILDFKLVPNTTVETTIQENENNTTEETTEETTKEAETNEENNETDDIQAMESNTQTTTTVNTNKLKATFKIESVGIEFN